MPHAGSRSTLLTGNTVDIAQLPGELEVSMRTLDLEPHEYRSTVKPAPERNRREPFWGPGAPEAIGYLIGWVLTVALLHLFGTARQRSKFPIQVDALRGGSNFRTHAGLLAR
jgi:hypothetical protein